MLWCRTLVDADRRERRGERERDRGAVAIAASDRTRVCMLSMWPPGRWVGVFSEQGRLHYVFERGGSPGPDMRKDAAQRRTVTRGRRVRATGKPAEKNTRLRLRTWLI